MKGGGGSGYILHISILRGRRGWGKTRRNQLRFAVRGRTGVSPYLEQRDKDKLVNSKKGTRIIQGWFVVSYEKRSPFVEEGNKKNAFLSRPNGREVFLKGKIGWTGRGIKKVSF